MFRKFFNNSDQDQDQNEIDEINQFDEEIDLQQELETEYPFFDLFCIEHYNNIDSYGIDYELDFSSTYSFVVRFRTQHDLDEFSKKFHAESEQHDQRSFQESQAQLVFENHEKYAAEALEERKYPYSCDPIALVELSDPVKSFRQLYSIALESNDGVMYRVTSRKKLIFRFETEEDLFQFDLLKVDII